MRKIPLVLLAAALFAPTAFAQPQTITTLFTGGNGGSSLWGNFFDINVTNPNGLRIVGFDVNASSAVNTAFTLDVYITPMTYVGNDGNAAAWTLVASGAGIGAGANNPTPVDTGDFFLAPGSYGIAIYYNGTGMSYTNGNGSNQMYSNADIALSLGISRTALFGGSVFSPRVWNGTVYYDRQTDASYGTLGQGCTGSNGIPHLAPASGSLPKIGQKLVLDVTNMPTTPGAASMLLGLDKKSFGGQPLPFDASVIGMTGCNLYVNFVLAFGFANTGGTGQFVLLIPNNASLLGQALLNQAFVFDKAANPAGATLSNAGEGQIGQ